ncbi:MAG TPA: NADPH-dependent F420 reductase [Actinomycetota bacterium]|nr:NADPH-dependent F420 reductase [Actinomycetota bacterium]
MSRSPDRPVAVVGGTGDLGFGLALRLAAAGRRVVIGSRSEDRGAAAAERARGRLGRDAPVEGAENAAAVAGASLVFVTVPYAGQAETYRSIREALPDGVVVCDTTTPLATAVGGRATHVLRPWHGSAAEQAAALLPDAVRLVAGFHSVGAEALEELGRPVDADVLLCGADAEAKAAVGELVDLVPGLRWVDCGPLSMARVVEPLTAVLIAVNRRYGIRDAGVRVSGRDEWGRPAR